MTDNSKNDENNLKNNQKLVSFKISDMQQLRVRQTTPATAKGAKANSVSNSHQPTLQKSATGFPYIESLLDTAVEPEVMNRLQTILDSINQHMNTTKNNKIKANFKKAAVGSEHVMALLMHLFEIKHTMVAEVEQP